MARFEPGSLPVTWPERSTEVPVTVCSRLVWLALILLGHLRVFTNVDSLLMALGMSEEGIQTMSSVAGGAAGIVILLAGLLRFFSRPFKSHLN